MYRHLYCLKYIVTFYVSKVRNFIPYHHTVHLLRSVSGVHLLWIYTDGCLFGSI